MNGPRAGERNVYFACPTCRVSLSVVVSRLTGEPVRDEIPWHFDARPLRPGQEREGCPTTGQRLPLERKIV